MILFPESEDIKNDEENHYKKGAYGTNQKTSGDILENDVYDYLHKKYPNDFIAKQFKLYGSNKKSFKTGKIKRKLNKIDVLWKDIIISAKNQFTGGTAEQKLCYELCILQDCLNNNKQIKKAFIVYNGNGMKIVEEEFEHIPRLKQLKDESYKIGIEIITFEDFKKRF